MRLHLHMGSLMPFVDILIFAIIAVFLALRLRSILGSRDGFEQPQRPFEDTNRPNGALDNDSNVIQMPGQAGSALSANGLDGVRRLDTTFRDDEFTNGAAAVFPMVLQAYADGDLVQLKRLLSFELHEEFSDAIRQRDEDGDQLKISIDDLKSVELLDGQVVDAIASVTVQYISIQTRELYDKDNMLIEDESDKSTEMTDIWVFERDIQDADPNWKLVETQTPESA